MAQQIHAEVRMKLKEEKSRPAPNTRPSFLQLLSALWRAEEDLKKKGQSDKPRPEEPQPGSKDGSRS